MNKAPFKVLVIDDEPPIRRLLRMSLVSQGYQVLEAANGRAGLAMIQQSHPNIIILDLGLPDIQGHDVIRILREQGVVRADCGTVQQDGRDRQGAGP